MRPEEAAGLVQLRQPKAAPTLVGIYAAEAAGLEDFGWATVCEVHSSLVLHDTLQLARAHAADPAGWCEPCRADATT